MQGRQRQHIGRMLPYELDSRAPESFVVDASHFSRERKTCAAAFDAEQDFRNLAAKIAAVKPPFSHVVLISHKMPRLADALGLQFSDINKNKVRVVSDFALPWIAGELREGEPNIAIVDDSINVGSTIRNVLKRIESCSTKDMKKGTGENKSARPHVFALYGKKRSDQNGYPFFYTLIRDKLLEQDEYNELASKVALRLHLLNKPYELEFPLLTLSYAPGIINAEALFFALQRRFGETRVSSLSHPLPSGTGLYRFAITAPLEEGLHGEQQIRLYADDLSRECRFVPMWIDGVAPGPLSGEQGTIIEAIAKIQRGMEKLLVEDSSAQQKKYCGEALPGEAKLRLKMFVDSLAFALRMLPDFSDLLDLPLESEPILSEQDMIFLFGKAEFYKAWEELTNTVVRNIMRAK